MDDGRNHGVHVGGYHALSLQGQRGASRRGRHRPPRQDGQQPAAQIFQGEINVSFLKCSATKHNFLVTV